MAAVTGSRDYFGFRGIKIPQQLRSGGTGLVYVACFGNDRYSRFSDRSRHGKYNDICFPS